MNSSNKSLKIIAVLFSLIVIALGTTVLVKNWHKDQMSDCRKQAESDCLEVIREMEADVNDLKAQLEKERETRPESEVIADVFGEQRLEFETVDCEKVETQLSSFYQHMDSQPYIADRNFPGGSAAFLQECATLLMKDKPVNIAEMKDLYRLMKNVTHLYKVLGKKRLFLLREILEKESEIIEPLMAMIFARSLACGKPFAQVPQSVALEGLYDYAGYFLNTLGGRSYLLRRDSTVRMLMNYYSILVVDRANDEKFNQYGIDIRPHIHYLVYDVAHQKGLVYRDRYLARLTALQNKYP